MTIDAGFIPVANIGDFVWVDANQDGLQNFGETVVPGVLVSLFDQQIFTLLLLLKINRSSI